MTDKPDISSDDMETEEIVIDNVANEDRVQPSGKVKSAKKTLFIKKLVAAIVLLVVIIAGAWYASEKYDEKKRKQAEAAHLARLQVARQQQIDDTLALAKKYYYKDRYTKASRYLQTVLSLDENNAEALRLEKDIFQAAGLAKVSPLRVKARDMWENTRRIDAADGFDKYLVKIKITFKKAETLFLKDDYSAARKSYQSVLRQCRFLIKLDIDRDAIESTVEECVKAKKAADKANAANDAKKLYQNAKRLSNKAQKATDKCEYANATKLYISAQKSYIKSIAYAKDYRAVILLKSSYKKLMKSAPTTNEMSQYSGGKWLRVNKTLINANRSFKRGAMSTARKQYKYVLQYLPPVISHTKAAMVLAGKQAAAKKAFNLACTRTLDFEHRSRALSKADLTAYEYCQKAMNALRKFSSLTHKSYLSNSDKNKLQKLQSSLDAYSKSLWNDTIPGLGMKFVYVSPGSFQMGSDKGKINEQPVHRVTIRQGYWIGKYEVTQNEYQFIMTSNPGYFKGMNRPVERVSWNDAVKFCRKLTARERAAGRLSYGYEFRLPTEAEWEFAARGGNKSRGYKYSGSDNVDHVAWYDTNSGGKTHAVGTKSSNELGIFDMSGNVLELCLDDWHPDYERAPPDGRRWDSGKGSIRVVRGGSWYYFSKDSRVASRFYFSHGFTSNYLGFRVVFAPVSK
jgi:formylglycine-generating enzyme required for sulfatase activity